MSNDPRTAWLRVNRHHRCVVCDKPDWCLISKDGEAAICARIESDLRAGEAGWLHRLAEPIDRSRLTKLRSHDQDRPTLNCDALHHLYRGSIRMEEIDMLAADLGVSEDSLIRLGIGWCEDFHAYTFPMRDGWGNMIGFRTRNYLGKRAVTGSRSGLFIPSGLAGEGPLLICEGPTDTAALLTIGFDAIGRPHNTGGVEFIKHYLQRRPRKDVWIMADADGPGLLGANTLAHAISRSTIGLKLFWPPGHKDARAWVRHGATHDIVSAVARNRYRWTPEKSADVSAPTQHLPGSVEAGEATGENVEAYRQAGAPTIGMSGPDRELIPTRSHGLAA